MFRARLNLIHNSSSHTALSMHGYIIQRDTPIWTSPSHTRSVVGKLTKSHLSNSKSGLHRPLPLQLRLRRQLRLHRKVHPNPQLHLETHLHLQLHLELEAKTSAALPTQGSGYTSKRSSESRQICDHVSMVSRRANNSSFVRNVKPVIIASRFSTCGFASLKT